MAQRRPTPGYAMLNVRTVGNYGRYVAPAYVAPVNSGGQAPAGEEEPAGEAPPESSSEAPAPSGPACKSNGAHVESSSECCSGYTEQHGTLHNGGESYCCGPSPNDCHSTNE
jgi:hypothetical protein